MLEDKSNKEVNLDTHSNSDIENCGIVQLPRHLDPNGSLTEFENTDSFPFVVKRVFYLYDVPADSKRGGHSHYQAHELIVAVSGAFSVTIDDGHKKKTYTLDRPYQGLYIKPGIWRTLDNFSAGAVCLVLTSEEYSEADYQRDYGKFLKLTRRKEPLSKKYAFLDLAVVNGPFMEELKSACNRVIERGRYIGGSEVEAFEREMLPIAGTPYCVAVSNGLDAMRLIFRAYLEMGRLRTGDEVIVPADTYVATVLAVTDSGLTPVFVDADWRTMNLDTRLIEKSITKRTRAIMPVHLYGLACWDQRLVDVVKKHDLLVIEDNAQGIGALAQVDGLYGTRLTGGLGHAGAFSFYPTKNIGALGDAGAVCTHDEELANAIKALRNYGSDRQYHNIYAGLNCRMDPMQAAMLRVKLPYVDEENALRRRLAEIYVENINNPLITLPYWPNQDNADECVWHQFVIRTPNRAQLIDYLSANGVETAIHYPAPPHKQPCYGQMSALSMPVAERIDSQCISLPITRCTSEQDAREIAAIINAYQRST